MAAKGRLCDHEKCESAWNRLAWWTLRERTEHGKYHSCSSSLIRIRNSSIISSPRYLRLNASERLEKNRDIGARRRECRRREVIKSHLPSRDTAVGIPATGSRPFDIPREIRARRITFATLTDQLFGTTLDRFGIVTGGADMRRARERLTRGLVPVISHREYAFVPSSRRFNSGVPPPREIDAIWHAIWGLPNGARRPIRAEGQCPIPSSAADLSAGWRLTGNDKTRSYRRRLFFRATFTSIAYANIRNNLLLRDCEHSRLGRAPSTYMGDISPSKRESGNLKILYLFLLINIHIRHIYIKWEIHTEEIYTEKKFVFNVCVRKPV